MGKRGPKRHFQDPADWDSTGTATATVAEVICRELARGLPAEMAAHYAGCSYATFKDWLVDGRRLIRRTHLDPNFEPTDDEAESMAFCVDVSEALSSWVQRTNGILEACMYNRRRVTTKRVFNVVKDDTGVERLDEVKRHVTEVVEPIDTQPILWRLSKIAPSVYGSTPRYERESEDGETENIDIAARVEELMTRIADTLTIVDDGTEESAALTM